MVKIVNLYGGPGSGKSTTAANIFYHMKMRGYKCELINEYAKELTWDESWSTLGDQSLVFSTQHHKVFRLKDKVDYIITDSPLLLTLLYKKDMPATFTTFVVDMHNRYENINFYINRTKKYEMVGRSQSEEESIIIDNRTRCLLKRLKEPFVEITVDTYIDKLLDEIL